MNIKKKQITKSIKIDFRQVDGYSNAFWMWGGEDDDMGFRIQHHNLTISRYPEEISRSSDLTFLHDNMGL